ncbi:carboxymuconolactone decarboxylase family protein [Psychromonas sp. Urea-02u-13]|uniref:carboxymuconolactone decarboxylase family protein n=1 Tax=Psychromonas sp. Urea-02u-13 TaxID=2058326 RepID=UPI0012FE841A|nr:hypothetical protein [Psychromonas sp. Urea-02u-13]
MQSDNSNKPPWFSATERSVLALTDEMTLIAQKGVSDKIYQAALKALGERQVAQVIMKIVMINTWNHFAISTKMQHQIV